MCHARDLYRGFSPLQHASGRAPDEDTRMFDTAEEKPLNNDLMEDGGFGQNIRAMCLAEKAFIDEQARQRVQRALAMGHRKTSVYVPGDLVFYWRRQQAGKAHQNFPKGRFLGPARVLATESQPCEGGQVRPSSVVWIHRGGRLLRAAPEQLRHASLRETMIEELKGPVEIPWTMTSLATSPNRRTYHDISQDNPDEAEWEMAGEQEPGRDHPEDLPLITPPILPRRRLREKRGPEGLPTREGPPSKGAKAAEKRGVKRLGERAPESPRLHWQRWDHEKLTLPSMMRLTSPPSRQWRSILKSQTPREVSRN